LIAALHARSAAAAARTAAQVQAASALRSGIVEVPRIRELAQ
jgi:hypothetical protein